MEDHNLQLKGNAMKSVILLTIALCTSVQAFSAAKDGNLPYIQVEAEANPLTTLDLLITATQKSLTEQKSLREVITEYQKTQKQYFENDDDAHLLKLVKSAHITLQKIKEVNLVHSFDPEFISELTRFSQVAERRGFGL